MSVTQGHVGPAEGLYRRSRCTRCQLSPSVDQTRPRYARPCTGRGRGSGREVARSSSPTDWHEYGRMCEGHATVGISCWLLRCATVTLRRASDLTS